MSFTIQRTLGIAPVMVLGFLLLTAAPGLAQTGPDLVVNALGAPPTEGLPGDSFVVTSQIKNRGTTPAGTSVTKFFLVPAAGPKKNLKGVQNIGALDPGGRETPAATVAIYSDTAPGTYALQACADGAGTVNESNELNNCLTAAGSITVRDVPDLAVTALSNPPASVPQGQIFTLASYKVTNQGPVPATASTMKFYLVSNADGTRIDLKGSAPNLAVPALSPAQVFTVINTPLKVRPETLPGSYRLQGCADSGKVVVEGDENDNCLLSAASVQVTPQPDLIVTTATVAGAPLTVKQGDPVTIDVVVKNQGLLNAGASTMKFIIVPPGGTPTKNLKGDQAVPPVPQGATVPVRATVTVYVDTVPGVYTLQACVDYDKVVGESSDGNNCTSAPSTITVTGIPLSPADLTVLSLTEPPATGLPGDVLQLTATVKNLGTGPSDPTVTAFYLVNDAGVRVKNLKGVQSLPAIAAGATVAPLAVPIALYSDTVAGSYFLQACADDDEQLAEGVKEANNCKQSAGKITVQDVADLAVTAIGNPPSTVAPGQNFPAATTYTVTNTAAVGALASTAKFYLVSTAADAFRLDLKGSALDLAVPALGPGQVFNHSVTLKVRLNMPPGTYRVLGCADSGKVVTESDEDDNCKASATTVQVTGLPDLVVSAVTLAAPSVTVSRGGTLPITAVVKNQGFANAPGSTIKLSLVVAPGTAAPIKTLIESPVSPIALGTQQNVPVSATIPSGTPVGTYVVQACVDSAKLVAESSDENNCGTSVDTVKVQ